MRRKVTVEALNQFMQKLAAAAKSTGKVYFTGGVTVLLLGFREQTIDIDLKLDPEPEGVFEAVALLKNELDINVKLASPDDFIPRTRDWRERSRHIASIGPLQFFHYDFALQALAKLERGHAQDLQDVNSFISAGFVTATELKSRFDQIELALIRYPALERLKFKKKVEDFLKKASA